MSNLTLDTIYKVYINTQLTPAQAQKVDSYPPYLDLKTELTTTTPKSIEILMALKTPNLLWDDSPASVWKYLDLVFKAWKVIDPAINGTTPRDEFENLLYTIHCDWEGFSFNLDIIDSIIDDIYGPGVPYDFGPVITKDFRHIEPTGYTAQDLYISRDQGIYSAQDLESYYPVHTTDGKALSAPNLETLLMDLWAHSQATGKSFTLYVQDPHTPFDNFDNLTPQDYDHLSVS